MPPQQFELTVYETYTTKDPKAPITGTEIQGNVGVTIDWGSGGASPPALTFDPASWLGAGAGPLTVYGDALGDPKPVGTVSWDVATHSIAKTETNTPEKKSRWTITPIVQLVRTFTPCEGPQPDAEVTYTASDTAKGAWYPDPAS
jgi:hypothetical protein